MHLQLCQAEPQQRGQLDAAPSQDTTLNTNAIHTLELDVLTQDEEEKNNQEQQTGIAVTEVEGHAHTS
jgi:hypothetical protein